MQRHLEPFDSRFRFIHWDVRHAIYNAQGRHQLKGEPSLPLDRDFDIIWLFSVFTHLDLEDARSMLVLLRRGIRPEGSLFFTAFIDPALDGVEGRRRDHPLAMVFYGERTWSSYFTRLDGTFEPSTPAVSDNSYSLALCALHNELGGAGDVRISCEGAGFLRPFGETPPMIDGGGESPATIGRSGPRTYKEVPAYVRGIVVRAG